MVAHPKQATMTVEAYLALEETSEIKHEYVRGYVYAMPDVTLAHDRIANNVRTVLYNHLGDGPWRMQGPSLRVRVGDHAYYYPDAFVMRDDTADGTATEVTTPRLVVEAPPQSTEANDRGDRFADYQTLAAFEEYLLVSSQRRSVERYHRTAQGAWTYRRYAPHGTVTLETIGLSLPVGTLYRDTQL